MKSAAQNPLLSAIASVLLASCASQLPSQPNSTDAGSTDARATDAGATDAGAADAGATDAGAAALSWVVRLDPSRGELPEGIALDSTGATAFVGLAPTGAVLRVDVATRAVTMFGSVPPPPPNGAYLLGLAVRQGELYAAVASSSAYPPGIYRFATTGGLATLYASHAELRFPNGLVFDDAGNLLVTDSLSGAIFKVAPGGNTARWASDPLLRGDTSGPCANGAEFPIGANGIVLSRGAVFTVNTDMGSLVRIPVQRDGSAGPASTFVASNCATLGGADGLAVDSRGHFFVAANGINALTEVSPTGEARVLNSGPEFDFPASPALLQDSTGSTLFVTNAALKSARMPGATPRPGLLRLSLR